MAAHDAAALDGRRRRAQGDRGRRDPGPRQRHGWRRTWPRPGLVDRYHLLVYPLVLGTGGKRLFADDGGKTKLELVEQESYANGIQKLCYEVVRV